MFPALLTPDEFRSRSIMPAAEIRRACGVQWKKGNDDATAATVTAETVFARAAVALGVIDLAFVPTRALVADPTNFATLTIAKRPAGGSPVTLGSIGTASLSWLPNVEIPIAIAVAPIEAGDALTVAIAKSGTGVIVPAGELFVSLSPSFLETTILDW